MIMKNEDMSKMINIEDFTVPPNIPKATGMRVIGIYPKFDYKNKLENAYGQNIAKLKGIEEKIRDTIAEAIKENRWYPYYYPKPATMERVEDVADIMRQLTGFTTRSAHIKQKKDTMFFYLVEFFATADEHGAMQSAEYWRRAWRTQENVNGKFDYIKTDENSKDILAGAKDLLIQSNYKKQDDGTYLRANIVSVLKSCGITNPTDTWINAVRESLDNNVGVMTNAEDFDVSDNEKLEDSVIVVTKTFGQVKDAKMDSQVLDDIEQKIVTNKDTIKDKLEKEEPYNISVVGKTKDAAIEKATKIRDGKKQVLLDLHKIRFDNHEVIRDLVINHGFSLEDALKNFWRGQYPHETQGEIYDN